MNFVDLGLSNPILRAVEAQGYHTATPIQAQAIPHILQGRDLLGCAQTGTGKTAAFALPILHRLAAEQPRKKRKLARALVLAPSRELAQQIAEAFQTYGQHLDVFGTVIFGGVGQGPQVQSLQRGIDIIVATPGRLIDLINQGHCDLSGINAFVLDEADRMLDMGFMPDIKRIISHLPDRKQTMLFSATMSREVRTIADALLHNPAEVTVKSKTVAIDKIEHTVYHVAKPQKAALLAELLDTLSISRAIVFTRTKHGADRVAKQIKRTGTVAESIHGDKTQQARNRALGRFRSGKAHVLVATDIAARGIDVDGISHVINYDMSRCAESHLHRIGRTARAGADGAAISFCDREELPYLKAIERLLRIKFDVVGHAPVYAKTRRTEPAVHPIERAHSKSKPSFHPRSRKQRKARRGNA